MSKILLKTNVLHDNYTKYACENFDLQINDTVITEIPSINLRELENFEWNIGLICGNSGSGKSTILKHIGNVLTPVYDYNKSIISQFPHLTEQEVTELFYSVGLSSVPLWLHKPNELSNGERNRLDICWILANSNPNEYILIDEFTSVVNRECAKSLSFALQRYVKEKKLKVILASCHYDIIEWVNPDWIFNLNKKNENQVDVEQIIYNDNENYSSYQIINPNNILTDKYVLN